MLTDMAQKKNILCVPQSTAKCRLGAPECDMEVLVNCQCTLDNLQYG